MSARTALAVAAASGFIALSYEIVWFRAFSFASGGAPGVFGALLGFYLLGLAFGADASRAFCAGQNLIPQSRQSRILAVFFLLANIGGFIVVPALAWTASRGVAALALVLVAVSTGMLGAILPLVSHFSINPDERAGAKVSHVYLANIIGSAAGSLLTGFVLMDAWRIQWIALLLISCGAAISAMLVVSHTPARGASSLGRAAVTLTAIGSFVALVMAFTPPLFDRVYEKLLFKERLTNDVRFADLVENRSGVIAVTRDGRVFGGGAYDGMISTSLVPDPNLLVRAYGIAAVHPAPREVLMIGLSTGAWAQVIVHIPGVEELTVIEINPGYLGLIRKYPQVAGLLSNPKVKIVIDDGRRWLARNPNRSFDVIVQNTTFSWRAHVTNLLSAEYLALVRRHLKPGGVFHYNTTSSEDALKTAFTTFPHGLRFINFATVSDRPVRFDTRRWREVLAGFRLDDAPVLDLERTQHREKLDQLVALAESLNQKPVPNGLETRDSVLERVTNASIITDDNMVSEWRFPWAQILRFPAWDPVP